MTNFTLFKSAIYKIPELRLGKKAPFWKVIVYIFFLTAILAIPVTVQVFSIAQNVKNDGLEIAKKLPPFEIKGGTLVTKENTKGFIYQTNSIIFTFDPQGKSSIQDVQANLIGNAFGVAFLKKEFVLVLNNSSVAMTILGSDQFKLPYTNEVFSDINQASLKNLLNKTGIPWWAILLIFVLSLYPVFLSLIINLFLLSIGAYLYTKLKFYSLQFLECLKIVTYCSTLPILLSSLIQCFNPSFNGNLLIISVGLMLFFIATGNEERHIPTFLNKS